jgi:hypothetical protein
VAVTKAFQSIAIGAGAIGAASIAGAQPAPPQAAAQPETYAVVWSIIPDQPIPSTMWLTARRSITSVRVQPRRTFLSGGEARAADGSLLVPDGAPLIGLTARTMIACATVQNRDHGVAAVWQFGTNRYICLVDQDRDGQFDHYFNLRTGTVGFLAASGRLPRDRLPMTPVPYRETDPRQFPNSLRMYVRYENFAWIVGRLEFRLCFSESGYALCITPGADAHSGHLPETIELLGAQVRVEAKEENRVQVTMLSPIPPQPFVISPF